MEETAPAAHVAEGHVTHSHVRTLHKHDLLPRTPHLLARSPHRTGAVTPTDLAVAERLALEEGTPVAVYDTAPRDGHVPPFDREDQMLRTPALTRTAEVLRIGVGGVVVVEVGTAEKRRSLLQMQFRIVAEEERPRQVCPWRHDHAPSRSGAGI